jgi:hypothetical protein
VQIDEAHGLQRLRANIRQETQMRIGCLVILGGSLLAGGCGFENSTEREDDNFVSGERSRPPAPPRLIAPVSTTHVTTKLPTLAWELPRRTTARVEICGDRACSDVLYTFEVDGTSVQPTDQLPDGVLYWRVTAVGRQGNTSAPSATWQFWTSGMVFPQPGLDGPPVDTTYGSVLDVNGDGFADLAVGAPGISAGGQVHVYHGGAAGVPDAPTLTLSGSLGYGASLASAGDVDGDGYGDLAIAGSAGSGSVEVRYGGANGLADRVTTLDRGAVTSGFGASLSTAMDVDGDGYADLVVGGVEHAQVFRGGAGGIATSASETLRGEDAVDSTMTPDARQMTAGGDVNGDRNPDVVVHGWIYLGTGSGFALQSTMRFLMSSGNLIGDNNGDGRCEYAGYFVHAGTAAGISATRAWGTAGQYMFGATGDTNGDGFNEVLASVDDITGLPPWRVYYGNPLEDTFGPQNEVNVPGSRPSMDTWAAAGDLNGDTLEDVAVGVPADGTVYVFMAPDVPVSPTRVLTGPGERFGAAVE